MTTRKAGGVLLGYNPRTAGPAPKGAGPNFVQAALLLDPWHAGQTGYLRANGSSYSLTLSLSRATSAFSCSRMYFAIVASFRPTVDT